MKYNESSGCAEGEHTEVRVVEQGRSREISGVFMAVTHHTLVTSQTSGGLWDGPP